MRITCYDGMGYIYLKPPKEEFDSNKKNKNEITNHVNSDQLNIPYVTDTNIASYLDLMTIAAHTFKSDHEKSYDTEYGNDMDGHGYITGIELTLYQERFIDLIKSQAFKVFRTEWRDKEFHVATFDHSENVFKSENVIYKLTDAEDAFVVVQFEDPKNLGYHYTNDNDQRRPIALFKALISARDDIYPIEYLLKPQFVM